MYVRRTIVQKANARCPIYDVIDRARRPALTDNQDQGHDGDFVQSLERGLSVIRAFDAEHPKLPLSEVAAGTGLSRAAARSFLGAAARLRPVLGATSLRVSFGCSASKARITDRP